MVNFNPRPPCGGRRFDLAYQISVQIFQSTSSVWRTTLYLLKSCKPVYDFNPRPPCGGRPGVSPLFIGGVYISIHVLRVEDDTPWSLLRLLSNISIHVLRVEDDYHQPRTHHQHNRTFQSTSSVWRTTSRNQRCKVFFYISIHVLRVEDDYL